MAGERVQFPLMHGHRLVPIARPVLPTPVWPNPWGYDPAVAARHAAIERSSHCVAVFLEAFPGNLLQCFATALPAFRGRRTMCFAWNLNCWS